MRILQIHNFYKSFGGECNVVSAERDLLDSNGHTVTQYTVTSKNIEHYPLWKKALTYLQIPHNFSSARRLDRFLKTQQPDVAHVHNVFPLLSPSIYRVLNQHRIPVVQTVHNYRFLCPNGLLFTHGQICDDCLHMGKVSAVKKKCMHGSWVTSAMYAGAIAWAWRMGTVPGCIDRFIALNYFGADLLKRGGVPEDKVRICGNFHEKSIEFIAKKEPYILYLGRLSPEKGIRTLLKAMSSVPETIFLKIAGSGPLEGELKDFVAHHPTLQVQFLGFVSGAEKERLIANALCSVVPSEWYENFPISVLESLAQGTPVIASRIGGLPELITHGTTGLLYEPGNAEALSQSITQLVNDPQEAQRMASAALESARTRFSPEVHLQELNAIYNECLQKRL